MYVLIILLAGHSPVIHDFSSERTCKNAMNHVMEYVTRPDSLPTGIIFAECLKK